MSDQRGSMPRHAAWLVAVVACLTGPVAARAEQPIAFVTGTDFFGSGCASWVSVEPPRVAHKCVEKLSSDPVARWAFGRAYVVNRYGADNVQVLDPASGFKTERQFSVGNGANPQDIAVVSPAKAFVSLLGASYLLVVDPRTGAALDSIPLGAFADADGIPEAAKMLVHGNRVFVALQRLTNFMPTDHSLVAVIDARADTVLDADPDVPGVQAIRLTGTNPATDLVFDPERNVVLLGEVGAYSVADGGVERIDPVTLRALGFETTEAKLGGELADVALAPGGAAYAVLNDFAFGGDATLVRYDRATGEVVRRVYATAGACIADIEINERGELWLCDRTLLAPGLRVYDTSADTLLAGPIDVGAPPFDVEFGSVDTGGVGPPPAGGLRILSVRPNPGRGALEIRFAVADGAAALPARLRVFDVRGAEVDRVEAGERGGGEHLVTWRPRSAMRPGLYLFRLERGGEAAGGRFVLVR